MNKLKYYIFSLVDSSNIVYGSLLELTGRDEWAMTLTDKTMDHHIACFILHDDHHETLQLIIMLANTIRC